MISTSIKFRTINYVKDSIGVERKTVSLSEEVPLIKVEDVYAKEYYEAEEHGHKPTLRLKISSLNYNNEQELVYMDEVYSIIRAQNTKIDEIVLICERKIGNG